MPNPYKARVDVRRFLNLPGFHGGAYVVAYVENTYSPSQYSSSGPTRARKRRPSAGLVAETLPLSRYSTTSGSSSVESMSTRTGLPVLLTIWCAPAFPRLKQTTSPSASSRSPSGVRSVGRPRRTIAHSSFPWWVC
jgi:hypothetical protein